MAEKYNLSKGSLEVIMREGEFPTPIMQVLGSKKITSGTGNKERFRMLLSDGKNSINFAMLTTQINDKVSSSGLETFTVIKIDKYITSLINNSGKGKTRVLLILDMTVLHEGSEVGERIGLPSPLNETSDSSKAVPTPKQNPHTSNKPSASNVTVAMDISENITSQNTVTQPISSLSPYHNKWAIKARVTNKSIIRTWSNSRGEGKLYSMDRIDESGEIRLTAFRDQVDKYYDFIQVDKVYFISKCQLKPANKQYSTLKNDYEMTMTSETYDFVTIDKIANAEDNSLIDVVGVTKSVEELQTFQARSTGRELKKKEVLLVDQSKTGITLTLWGSDAENFDGVNNPVIVLKSVKIGEFGGGKHISMISSSTLQVNPEMKECYRLRGWYDSQGSSFEAKNISARSGLRNFNTPWMSFKEMQD
nr:replication protein A 70 kDa DNA-binding subunit-like [Leptinotarsa decemlineata]